MENFYKNKFGNFLRIGHFKMSIFIFFTKDFFRKMAFFSF